MTPTSSPLSPAWSPDYASLDADLYLTLRSDLCSPEQRDVLRAAEHPRLNGGATPHVPGRIVASRGRIFLHPDLPKEVGTILGDALKHAADRRHDPALSNQATVTLNELLQYAKAQDVRTSRIGARR